MQSVRHVTNASLKLHYLYLTFTITSNMHPFNLNTIFHLTILEFSTLPLSCESANGTIFHFCSNCPHKQWVMTYVQMRRHYEANVRSFFPRLLKYHALMAHMKFSSVTAKLNYIIKLNNWNCYLLFSAVLLLGHRLIRFLCRALTSAEYPSKLF